MSKIKYIKHNDIDFDKWDKTVLSSEYPLVFAQSFYLNATCPKWDALIIGDYESIFPLTIKTKLGFKYLPQPSFTSQLGVYGIVDAEVESLFYNYIAEQFKLIEIELNASNKIKNKYISPKKTYFIEYSEGYKYNQNTKRNIKKALDNEFKVDRVEQKESLMLSKKLIDPFLGKDLGLSKTVIKTFNALIENADKHNSLLTFKTTDKKKNIKALAHFIFNNEYALYLKGTNFDKYENSGSMHLLIDAAIKHFEDRIDFFDFGGGSSSGLASFYAGLGGRQLTYGFLKINRLPKVINVLKGKKN